MEKYHLQPTGNDLRIMAIEGKSETENKSAVMNWQLLKIKIGN